MTTADYRQLMAQAPASVPGRNGKYNAKKCEYKGIIFDSLGEMKRYKELEVLVRVGEIFDLQRQITHSIVVNDVLICKYKSDFEYSTKAGERVVEDFKGFRTPEYKIKRNLMLAVNGVSILETGGNTSKKGGSK
ncbi:DUF1064 domain-containing protein [Pseudomonas syringae pv. actinidiae]|nr:DUF1064 domain-containing protein [Pseudomonas syringae pv. actinidiae]